MYRIRNPRGPVPSNSDAARMPLASDPVFRWSALMDSVDVIVIGAGHNGLACACHLASAGLKVRVLERRSVVGGAAVTEEFFPGFRNSSASYTVSLLNPAVIRDLNLARRGLRIIERPFSNFLPTDDGRFLRFGGASASSEAEIRKFSRADADGFGAFCRRLERVAGQLKDWVLRAPPELGGPLVVRRPKTPILQLPRHAFQ